MRSQLTIHLTAYPVDCRTNLYNTFTLLSNNNNYYALIGFERSFLRASQIDLFFCLPILHKQQQHGKDFNCILYSLFKISAKKHIERKFHIFLAGNFKSSPCYCNGRQRRSETNCSRLFPLVYSSESSHFDKR